MHLTERTIIIDFEATDRRPERAEPIEVAALAISGGRIEERMTTLIHLSTRIPAEVQQLTGITDEMLRGAPGPDQVAGHLRAFIGDSPLVAHNASYDGKLLEKLLGDDHRLMMESCELACLMRPELESHRLSALVTALGLDPRPEHRAEADVETTFQVVNALLQMIAANPSAQVRFLLRTLSGSNWPWISHLEAALPATGAVKRKRPPAHTEIGLNRDPSQLRLIPLKKIDQLFSHGGALAGALPGYQPREQQIEMARLVANSLNIGRHAMVEAPTGVGKSLGYLVPLSFYALENKIQVAVSTDTKSLQDQLDQKDLPAVRGLLGDGFRWEVIKGAGNYICMSRVRELARTLLPSSPTSTRVALAYLGSSALANPKGTLDQLSYYMIKRHPALEKLTRQVKASNCIDRQGHEHCPMHQLARRARRAHMLVMNHSLLLTGARHLPTIADMVVDEAHMLEERATAVLSRVVSRSDLFHLSNRLREAGNPLSSKKTLSGAMHITQDLNASIKKMDSLTRELLAAGRKQDKGPGYHKLELDLSKIASRTRSAIIKGLKVIAAVLGEIVQLIRSPTGARSSSGKSSRISKGRQAELENIQTAAEELLDQLGFIVKRSNDNFIYLIELGEVERLFWTIRAEPVELGSILRQHLFSDRRCVVLTSATLTLGDEGEHMKESLGYPGPTERGQPLQKIDSPWNEAEAVESLVVTDLPALSDVKERASAMSRLIQNVAIKLGGRTLVLFTALSRMRAVAHELESRLEGSELRLLVQGLHGGLLALVEQMRLDQGTILLGCQGLWQGTDIVGNALSCVIIERIPFESHERPIIAARMERFGGNSNGFSKYLLPRALLKLRQGTGRLIRSASDRGVVILCHEGITQKGYRALVAKVMPGDEVKWVTLDNIGNTIRPLQEEK